MTVQPSSFEAREPSSAPQEPQPAHSALSALADGDREALPQATALWRDDAAARESWHLYHLIGDVMRSEDLATAPARDGAFLEGLRARLANEPVPLAPAPMPAAPLVRRLGWRAPAAVAAGFVAVAATVVLLRGQGPQGVGEQLAADEARPSGGGLRVVTNPHPSAGGGLVIEGRMIRDPRLEAYLQAHQSVRGNSPAALPGGGMRSAELLVTPMVPGATAPKASTPLVRPASEPR